MQIGQNTDVVTFKATSLDVPPAWAFLQRKLIGTMEGAAQQMLDKYTEPGGALFFADDVDDMYERFCNWPMFYALGGDRRFVDWAFQQWNATTRWCDDSVTNRLKHSQFHEYLGGANKRWRRTFHPQIHNEYYNLAEPARAEWHHKGEGNMAFYYFGVGEPGSSENIRRARRFAAMYIGEDPEAPNYDPKHKVFRSPFQSSVGPWLHNDDVNHVKTILQGPHPGTNLKWTPQPMGQHASLFPVISELEPNWFEDPVREKEVMAAFDKIVLNCDIANNLTSTALVTNAYLYTGEEKYRKWVLDYVEAWMDRIKANGGIIPDNVGPTGRPGEHRDGIWWGGMYGWNSKFGCRMILHGATIAAECALMLSGDFGYLDLLRSQLKMLLDNAIHDDSGNLLVPWRHGPDGWDMYKPVRMIEPAHLYHASMAAEDFELMRMLRQDDKINDWDEASVIGEKNEGEPERSRFQYYEGLNPSWPETALQTEYRGIMEIAETTRLDERSVEAMIDENLVPPNPVYTKALTQQTMGCPQTVYNGGLLRATVRYFDSDVRRPGLPRDVAALVKGIGPENVRIYITNLNATEPRNLIVQAGAFGEHSFTELEYNRVKEENMVSSIWNGGIHEVKRTNTDEKAAVNGKYFAVQLPPFRSIEIDAGMRRFVNRPSYAFPWHGGKLPAAFQ